MSVCDLALIISRDFFIGVFVNKDTALCEFKIPSSSSVTSSMVSAKCLKFFT